jgi:hypothetical protein
MIYEYVVTLKNLNRKAIDRFSMLVCGVSALLFLSQAINMGDAYLLLLLGAAVVLLLTGYNAYQLFKNKKRVRFNYVLIITGLVWTGMPFFPWLSILLVIMGLVEPQSKKDLEIGFSDEEIVFNTLPRKRYEWSEFSNIVLRDNLLTLDFNNNKLFQRETVDDDDEDCDEDEFNQYCRRRLGQE